jgi:Phage Terminase
MTTATSSLGQALNLIGMLTLPDGRRLSETLPDDSWIVDNVLTPILVQDDAGRPVHRQVWIELARGHAKTSSVAAVAMAEALRGPVTHIYALASDQDQARLLIEAIAGQCFRSPKLRAAFTQSKDEFTVKSNGSRIRVMSSDAPSFYGIGVDARRLRIVCDELCQWPKRDLYDAALTTLPKVQNSQLIVITNAGVVGSWQEEARQAASQTGYVYDPKGVIASWIRQEDLDRLRLNVPPAVFARFYDNRWTEAAGGFVSREALLRCVDPDLSPRLAGDAYTTYCVGLDLGLNRDRTARAVCHFDREADLVILDNLRVWQGTRENPVSIAEVEHDLLACDAAFNRPSIYVYPWQLQGTIQRLSTQLRIEEYTFSSGHVGQLSETLYSLISSAKLRLYPDKALEAELLGLEARQVSYGWRLDHRAGGYSDRAMALGMACLGALEDPGAPNISFIAYG